MSQDEITEVKAADAGNAKLRDRALGPATEQFGKELAPLGAELAKTTTLVGTRLLCAVNGLVYGYDFVGDWLKQKVAENLKGVPDEKIVEPDPSPYLFYE